MTAAFSELPNRAQSEVFALSTHPLKECSEILGNLLCTYQILSNLPCIELGTYVLALFLNRCDGLRVLEVGLCRVFVAEGAEILKLFLLSLLVN